MKFKIFKWFFKTSKNRNLHTSTPSQSEHNTERENAPLSTSGPQESIQRRMPLRHSRKGFVKQHVSSNTKLKSYPTSPKRAAEEDRGYVSDYNSSNVNTLPPKNNSKTNLKSDKIPSTFVFMASEQRDSAPFKPRATLGSNEPFPFLVPTDPAPRHSLFYDLSYGVDAQNSLDETPQQPERIQAPRISINPRRSQTVRRFSKVRRVSRIPPAHEISRPSVVQGYEMRGPPDSEEPVRRTIVKVKPYRIANCNKSTDVHRLPLKPPKHSSVRISIGGKLLHPVNKDKIGKSLRTEECMQSSMKIVQEISNDDLQQNTVEEIPTNDPGLTANGTDPLSDRKFEVDARHDNSEEDDNEGDKVVYEHFHFKQNETKPVVYAVPTVSKKGRKSILQTVFQSRGRPKSILQDSAKSLTSKNQNDRPDINRKNIRCSMDTDVFSPEHRGRSVNQPQPMYVNMERGGSPILVSEVLNPITSLFISDLKDPVPKDPLNKPKERNIWVKPKSAAPVAKKPPQMVQVFQEPTSKPQGMPNQKSSNRSYTPYEDEYTSSDESIIVYKRSKPSNVRKSLRKQNVYAAHTPNMIFPQFGDANVAIGGTQEQPRTHQPNDSCGLVPSQNDNRVDRPKGILLEGYEASSNQLDDFEDELDLICYPSENMLKDSPNATESKSKLRWRIIIKRGEDK